MGFVKSLLRGLLRLLYRVEVRGLEHYREAGERVLVVANHTSFLDAVLLAAFLPGRLTFAINTHVATKAWVRPFLHLTDVFPMDPTNPLAIKSLVRFLQRDRKAVIFPEGRITVTGALMKVYQGTGLVADKSEATVLPVRIDGAQYSPFSRLKGRVRRRWFPRIALTVLPPRRVTVPPEARGRTRRKRAGQDLADLMTEMMFATTSIRQTLVQALLDARRVHGGSHLVAEDIERRPMSYDVLLARGFILGRLIARVTRPGERIGILLPSTNATLTTFLASHLHGRVPVMLNFTAGAAGMLSACETAEVRRIYTSRRFVAGAKLGPALERLAETLAVTYLEDVRDRLGVGDKLAGLLAARAPRLAYRLGCFRRSPDDPAVVLFTSGSEGLPKGVVLSHANLLANRAQLTARVDFGAQDIILNALPLFHSFGLTAGTVLPLLSGVKVFFYPSPLHFRIVPEMAYDINATIMFGTNTFLAGYARFAHPYDFYSVRYVFAGAEKLHEETRRVWAERFGVRIFEGYGATETSPVLASNTPMDNRAGSVGRLLPGIEHRLQPVPGIEAGGRLQVKGPNVMCGYLLHDRPGALRPPVSEAGAGWYDTGDIVDVDAEGFLWIRGRARRFAKIGGEMVSLAALEELVQRTWPGYLHAVVSVPDPTKGEQLVLLTECPEADRAGLLAQARREGLPELGVPRHIWREERLPLLATGKVDYPRVQRLASARLGAPP